MKYFLIVLTMNAITNQTYAQTTEDSVKAVISKMFTAMKNADSVSLKNCFADNAIMQSISQNKEGRIQVRNDGVRGFIEFVGEQAPGAADERISFETIKIDGPLAIAWTPYHLYYNGQFSHCGVNSFQIVRLGGEWKITYIIDTRRRQGCKPE